MGIFEGGLETGCGAAVGVLRDGWRGVGRCGRGCGCVSDDDMGSVEELVGG